METVYLKELKNYSVSEIMNFREKYVNLINKLANQSDELESDGHTNQKKRKRSYEGKKTTEEKILQKQCSMIKEINNSNKKSKTDYKELPALLPLYIPNEEIGRDPRKPGIDLIPEKDVVFVFKVYPPFVYDPNNRSQTNKHNMEIVMLGHQTLNLFCDKIVCGESYMEVGGDISDTPDIPIRERLGEKYKSRMLYIGNTFYIDKSDPKNIDYSEMIKKWGKANNLFLGETLDMHKYTCLDLVARLGYPYVYQHLGGCEHIFRIAYVRLLQKKDCLESKLYPFYNYLSRGNSKLCMACMEISQWIIFDSPRMLSNPSFLCNSCFRSYHYVDGKKIGTFSAVRYWDCPVFLNIFDRICKKNSEEDDID